MLSGDNGILQKATDAKTLTERSSVVEQARADVLGYQAENKGGDLDKTQLKTVLDKYFDGVPDLTDMQKDAILNTQLNTLAKYGIHSIAVYEIYNGNLKNNSQKMISFNIKEEYFGNKTYNFSCLEGSTWDDWANATFSEPFYTDPSAQTCGDFFNGSLQELIKAATNREDFTWVNGDTGFISYTYYSEETKLVNGSDRMGCSTTYRCY